MSEKHERFIREFWRVLAIELRKAEDKKINMSIMSDNEC